MAAATVEEGGGGGAVARIFVGGISEGVAAADLEAMFASVGRVAGVEFVRTNGRSFAYVDFHCPSDKALAKLFSTVRIAPQSSRLSTPVAAINNSISSLCLFVVGILVCTSGDQITINFGFIR